VKLSEEHFWKKLKILYHLDKFRYEKIKLESVCNIQTRREVSGIKVNLKGGL